MNDFVGQGPWIFTTTLKAFGLLQHDGCKAFLGITFAVAFPKYMSKFVHNDLLALFLQRALCTCRRHLVPIGPIKESQRRLSVSAVEAFQKRHTEIFEIFSALKLSKFFGSCKAYGPMRFGFIIRINGHKGKFRLTKPRSRMIHCFNNDHQIRVRNFRSSRNLKRALWHFVLYFRRKCFECSLQLDLFCVFTL
jgi:hypothetical protein